MSTCTGIKMKNKTLPTQLQGIYIDSIGEFSNTGTCINVVCLGLSGLLLAILPLTWLASSLLMNSVNSPMASPIQLPYTTPKMCLSNSSLFNVVSRWKWRASSEAGASALVSFATVSLAAPAVSGGILDASSLCSLALSEVDGFDEFVDSDCTGELGSVVLVLPGWCGIFWDNPAFASCAATITGWRHGAVMSECNKTDSADTY